MRISAIDLGSNAARMIVAEWHGDRFEILKKYRTPLRLGTDVFQTGVISPMTLKKAEECFHEFSEVNQKMGVIKCRAVATSAVRESKNKQEFLNRIKTSSRIDLEMISGLLEAQLVFEAVKHQVNLKRKNALLIDVGGGSVEVTHVEMGTIKNSQSFPLGTVRMLEYLRLRKMSEQHIKIVLGDLLRPVVEFFDKKMSGDETKNCSFKSTAKVEGNQLIIEALEIYNSINYPKSSYPEYRTIFNAASDFSKSSVVLKQKK